MMCDPETARRLSNEDPAVRAGRLAVEVMTWMVPAGNVRSRTAALVTDCYLVDGEGRNRTGDTTVFSRVLYQLSYLAARGLQSNSTNS